MIIEVDFWLEGRGLSWWLTKQIEFNICTSITYTSLDFIDVFFFSLVACEGHTIDVPGKPMLIMKECWLFRIFVTQRLTFKNLTHSLTQSIG